MRIIFGIAFLFTSLQAIAQNGIIEGNIIHKADSSILSGVTVYLNGTSNGGTSDMDGNFKIDSIEAGTYSLTLEYLGLYKDTITNIIVLETEITKLQLGLPVRDCNSKTKLCPITGHHTNRLWVTKQKTHEAIRTR
jgi:hypothetical protein